MSKRAVPPLAFVALVLSPAWLLADKGGKPGPAVGGPVADFTLTDARTNAAVTLAEGKSVRATVVVFLGTACPVNNLYLPTLAKMHEEYKSKGVRFLGVNSV